MPQASWIVISTIKHHHAFSSQFWFATSKHWALVKRYFPMELSFESEGRDGYWPESLPPQPETSYHNLFCNKNNKVRGQIWLTDVWINNIFCVNVVSGVDNNVVQECNANHGITKPYMLDHHSYKYHLDSWSSHQNSH